MKEKLIELLKKNDKKKACDEVIRAISYTISDIDEILCKVNNTRAEVAYMTACEAYFIAKGYTKYNSKVLADELDIGRNDVKRIINELEEEGVVRIHSREIGDNGVSYIALEN